MEEKQYPISVDELVGPYEVLEDIVAKRNILADTLEASNPFPDAALPTGNQLTFKQKWERCRNQFSALSAKRIDLLIDTVCRDLVLHHILSRKERSLAEEISKLDQPSGSLINTDLMDSKSVVGTHLTQSNESSNKLCEGHEYDRFGVVIPHPEPLPCPPELIAAVCTRTRDKAFQCTSLEEVCDKLNTGWDEYKKKDTFPRPEPVLVHTICHLHLPPRSFKPWTDNLKFVRNVNQLLKSDKLRGKYRFIPSKSVLSRESHNGTLYSVDCVNAHLGTKAQYPGWCEGVPHEEYLACRGKFEVCVYPELNVIAFSYRHKDHGCGGAVDSEWFYYGENGQNETNVVHFLDEESVTEENALKMLKSAFPNSKPRTIKMEYDNALKRKNRLHHSAWLSLMKFHTFSSSKVAHFTFYSAESIGYAVIYKGFVEKTAGAVDSAGLHTIKIPGQPKCEVVAVIADVCGEGIPVGYMLISPISEVAKDVLTAHPATTKNGDAEGFDTERPLPQCEIAKMVESVCKSRFPTNPKLALISSFLLLLKGTENPLIVSQLGCRNAPLPKAYRPSCSSFEETVCPMAAKIDPDHELYWKRTPRVDVPYFACEKDLNQIQALKFTHPESVTLLGFCEVLRFLKPALKTLGKQKGLYSDFIDRTRFPLAFMSLCPQMFDKVPHSAENCPYKTTTSWCKCWQCHPEFYNTRTEPELSIPELPEKEIFPKVDTLKKCTYSKLVHMMIEHAAANPKIPQLFTYLSMIVPVSKTARFYPPDGLRELILGDMLSFCLKFGLLHLFRYLWTRWYCEKWFGMWTRCETNVCKLLARRPTLPVFESMFNNASVIKDSGNRIDTFVMRQYKSIKQIQDNLKILTEFVKIPSPEVRKWNNPEWSVQRRNYIYKTLRNLKSHESDFQRDCEQYGTDVVMFVCGCNAYKKNDFHLCEHIIQGINKDSPFRFDKTRARSSPPFYTYDRCDEKFPSDAYTWKTLIFDEQYLEFWNTAGAHIVERNGGRKWHEQQQTPFKANRREVVRKRALKKPPKKRRKVKYGLEIRKRYGSDTSSESESSDSLYFR